MTDALKRRIGPGLLTAYGVGVMVGAGIYVLVGGVAAEAGIWAPLSFLLAGLIAAPSALSYAELSTRIPEAAGEAAYIEAGLASHRLAVLVGLAIVIAGTVSAAAVLRGGVGYLTSVIDVPSAAAILIIGAALMAVASIGVLESLGLAALFTLIEVIGLALVVWAGFTASPSPDWTVPAGLPLAGLGVGATLAFFAFIGFEDIVNMAEEVRNPARSLPIAILCSLVITTLLYILVSFAAVRALPLADLAASEQPLVLVWQARMDGSAGFLALIAVAAALNGVLAQLVMAARVLFGLGKRSPRLALFRRTHARFGTPVLATLLVGGAVIAAALLLPVVALASVTSTVLLSVFVLINLALIRLKARLPEAPFRVHAAVPWVGLVAALAALVAFAGGQIA
jgi:basic amino acid/polyamine antiporter, APA family